MYYSDRQIFAHRGMSGIAPENTLCAFRKCADYSVQWFELDVDVISDGTVIVCHDSTLDRTTNRTGSYYELSFRDLENIDAGFWFSDNYIGEKLPTLAQVIDLMNELDLNANIEIKGCEAGKDYVNKLLNGIHEQINRLNSERKIIVSSFNHLILSEFKRKMPEIPVACLWDKQNFSKDWDTIMQMIGAEYVHLDKELVTKEIIDLVHTKGYKINVWTVNDLSITNQLFNWGADGIFTDNAHLLPYSYLE